MLPFISRYVLCLGFLALCMPNLAKAQGASEMPGVDEVVVRIETSRPKGVLSSYLTGSHFVYAFESDALYGDERIVDWMKCSRVGTIRWPGGTAVQYYHWDTLTGIPFSDDAWDPKAKRETVDPSKFMDVDEYLAYCVRAGVEPMVGINIRSGKVYDREDDALDEARRLITHCRAQGHRVKYWYIGNEGYAKGFSPQAYAEVIERYTAVLKAVDPEITIIGDWKLGPIAKNRFNQSIEIVRLAPSLDMMEFHEKWGNEWGLASGQTWEDWLGEFPIYDGKLGHYIKDFRDSMEEIGRPEVQIGFNEWGLGKVQGADDFGRALVAADFLIELFRHEVDMACYWNLNMGSSGSRILTTRKNGTKLKQINPIAEVFTLFGEAQAKRLLDVKTTDRGVYGFAASDEAAGSVQLFLLNKNKSVRTLTICGLEEQGELGMIKESFSAPGRVVTTTIEETRRRPVVKIEPLTLTRITLRP